MISKDKVRFRGKAIDDLTTDELKTALMQALNWVDELQSRQLPEFTRTLSGEDGDPVTTLAPARSAGVKTKKLPE